MIHDVSVPWFIIEAVMKQQLHIRHAMSDDLEKLYAIESRCFPPDEACGKEQMKERLETYSDHFWILERDGAIVSFTDGLVSNSADLNDDMYADVHMHTPHGRWLMILGVDTDPDWRQNGYASKCLQAAFHQSQIEKLYGIVLTCKEEKIPFYERNGFLNEGRSTSVHGNAAWYQMRSIIAPDYIETEHLILHKPKQDDLPALYSHLLQDDSSSRYMAWRKADTMNEAQTILNDLTASSEKKNHFVYIIDEKGENNAIGFASFKYNGMHIFEEDGIAIGPDYRHHGYGGEILDSFLQWSFEKLNGNQFIYGCLKANTASRKLAESRGFALHRENTLYFEKDGVHHPHLVYTLNKKDYLK